MDFLTILFTILLSMSILHSSEAQNSPQDYINVHNSARAQVGVGNIVWDNNVAAYARNYANQRINDCNMVHSGGPYGENLAAGSGNFNGVDGVRLWVNEKGYYDYNSNSCVGGECRHYTQVVWRNSVRVGCARVKCTNNGWFFVICSYDPPGNYIGQRPFEFSSSS